jgi:cardiolipin synthase A/B
LKLLVQPDDGIAPLISAIRGAKKSIDILIFRLDHKEVETALKAASAKGLAVRALIAHTNRGGESRLRSMEMRFLAAGIVVARTAGDLIRYHGKMVIIDRQTLFLLSFNFVHLDIDHSRGFGLITKQKKVVQEAVKLFEADSNRQPYTPTPDTLIVSPTNARQELSAFLQGAKKQLLIYDPKLDDKKMVRIVEDQAKAGLEIKIIGAAAIRNPAVRVSPLTTMRLHTRTIIRDGKEAFIGSQSLRRAELEQRREIGIIVRDPKIVKTLLATFDKDWAATGFDEAHETAKIEPPSAQSVKAGIALVKEMPPLQTTVKEAIKQAVSNAGKEALSIGGMKSTLKDAVKEAMKEAVKEIAQEG